MTLRGLCLLVALVLPGTGLAQNCRKGKPCGNSCIARDKVCHVGQGTAHWALGADSTRAESTRVGPTRAEPRTRDTGIVGRTSECIVARVIDGDTIVCEGGRRVRLLLVDAPESDQGEFGWAATNYLKRLVPPGTAVTLESDVEPRDQYGRDLAYVWLEGGRMANEELARAGMVVVLSYPPNVQHVDRIRAAVEAARQAKRGLWATSAFECAPVDHRRGRC